MKVAITGASGFLGKSLALWLSGKGHELYLHARSDTKAESIKNLAKKLVICDITDTKGIGELVADADIVIHTVSNFRSASGPPESYKKINLNGTSNAFESARKAGVRRFIHISTIGVFGDIKECPASETTEYNPGDNYQRTKLEAELYCREQANKGIEMELVVIRPCSMYGPGDMRMLKMFRMLKKSRFFVVGACDANFHAVYIDDVLSGIYLAMTKDGIDQEVFILGGKKYVSLKQYITTAAHAVDSKYPWIKIPFWPLYMFSAVVEFACVPFNIEPPIFRRRVKFYRNNRAFDISKARDKLGYSPSVSLEDGMDKTVEWYHSEGYL
ncbi:MAG: NAD-dependent epimerase/dehydratase family protein [Gammaproteobacteria bacterium]